MSLKKITYIISNVEKAIAFEWIVSKIDTSKFKLSFIVLNKKKSHLFNWLKKKKIECYYVNHSGKRSYPATFLKLLTILLKIRPKVVHTHLFDANLLGLSAAKLLRIKKRIHTRHHSSLNHQFFPHAVKYDRFINYLSTDIISITDTVKSILVNQEKCMKKKIHLVLHGFDLKAFQKVTEERVNTLKSKYNIAPNNLVIGVISRYTKWKGVQNIIPAFKKILIDYPDAVLILANAKGDYEKTIKSQLINTLPSDSYREILFEPDFMALYKLFNVFVHAPIDNHSEAFGQIYIESLASKVPSVFTLSGIANEFIKDGENALVVPYNNSKEIEKSILYILKNPQKSKELVKNGVKSVQQFNLKLFINKLEKLYSK